MTHRPGDIYEYVATQDITVGSVCAFREGDAVPASTVEEYGLLELEAVVHREDFQPQKSEPGEKAPALRRGEMPPHLQSQRAKDADKADEPGEKAGARKTTAKTTGKASE